MFTVEVKFHHILLVRANVEEISVTVSPYGYIVDAHSEYGYPVDLTFEEKNAIFRLLFIEEDEI